MKGIHWITLFTLGTGIAGCTANSKDQETRTQAAQVLPVTQLVTRETPLHREYVGDVHAYRNVEIYARVKGYLEHIYVDEGQEVRKGQVLFRINEAEYQSEHSQAKATLQSAIAEAKTAELQVKQVKLLVDKKVIAKTELEVAQAKLAAATARIEEARSAQSNAALRLANTTIKAPFDGIIDRIPHKAGSLIDEGTLLTTVSDIKSVYAYFNVSENEYLEYMKARKANAQANQGVVELILADGTNYPYRGKIETMEGEFDAGTGSIAFRATFPNPQKLLKHGSTGTIRLTNLLPDALIVPQKAAFEIQDKNFVYVVDKHNRVSMKSFVPKNRFAHYYVVESGLKPGERVVYEGVQGLRNGMTIVPKLVPMDTTAISTVENPKPIELTAN